MTNTFTTKSTKSTKPDRRNSHNAIWLGSANGALPYQPGATPQEKRNIMFEP